jgi:hydroxyethylthiazole kinase-like sugar kinase family protein
MGFFKKIGKSVKKVTKQISLKNAIKIGTPLLGSIPVAGNFLQSTVSGLSEAHQAKKMQAIAQAQGNTELANQYAETAKLASSASGGAMGTVAGGIVKNFATQLSQATVSGAYDGISDGLKTGVAKTGATLGNAVLTEWLKKHWWKLVAGLAVLGGVIFFATKRGKTTRRR